MSLDFAQYEQQTYSLDTLRMHFNPSPYLERTLNLRRDLVLFELAAFHTNFNDKGWEELGNEDDLSIVFALTPGEREG